MSLCSCGSKNDYFSCCRPYITGKTIPQTPEILMRSRYTAYTKVKIDYIKSTMRNKSLIGFNEQDAERWATSVHWVGLEIIKTEIDKSDPSRGLVEFIATYRDRATRHTIHEISQFEYIEDRWFYVDGELLN